jgi:hypothetical protein
VCGVRAWEAGGLRLGRRQARCGRWGEVRVRGTGVAREPWARCGLVRARSGRRGALLWARAARCGCGRRAVSAARAAEPCPAAPCRSPHRTAPAQHGGVHAGQPQPGGAQRLVGKGRALGVRAAPGCGVVGVLGRQHALRHQHVHAAAEALGGNLRAESGHRGMAEPPGEWRPHGSTAASAGSPYARGLLPAARTRSSCIREGGGLACGSNLSGRRLLASELKSPHCGLRRGARGTRAARVTRHMSHVTRVSHVTSHVTCHARVTRHGGSRGAALERGARCPAGREAREPRDGRRGGPGRRRRQGTSA